MTMLLDATGPRPGTVAQMFPITCVMFSKATNKYHINNTGVRAETRRKSFYVCVLMNHTAWSLLPG